VVNTSTIVRHLERHLAEVAWLQLLQNVFSPKARKPGQIIR
jgi:hypothetical protein